MRLAHAAGILAHLPWAHIHLALSAASLAAWAAGLWMLQRGRKRYGPLEEVVVPGGGIRALPRLSILVPARNEAGTIEQAMRSLLALDYAALEIIAVNDRSTDQTGALLERLACIDARLRVIHVTSLPDGWLGKNHALQTAADYATGEWLLFTDADVVFAPNALRRAVAYARARNIDHLVLAPTFDTRGFWERLFISYFALMFSFRVRPWDVADPDKRAYIGLGVFNLVRAAAYRSFGGHAALRLDVTDDTKLGKLMKSSGYRQEVLDGSAAMSVRWIIGLRGAVDGLTKNAFAGFEFKLPAMCAGVISLLAIGVYPVVAVVGTGVVTRAMGAATLLLMMAGAAGMKRLTGAGPTYGLAYPLACCVLVYVILRSTWHAYSRGGVEWRGTRYPLEMLRDGVV